MGPRFFNRGKENIRQQLAASKVSFNGAAVFQPRKALQSVASMGAKAELQWGRGFSTAERSSSPFWA